MNLSPFIQRLPKAELHLHIEGTLEPELMLKLAARNNVPPPFRSPAEAKDPYRFSNLDQFLHVYYRSMSVLRTERGLQRPHHRLPGTGRLPGRPARRDLLRPPGPHRPGRGLRRRS